MLRATPIYPDLPLVYRRNLYTESGLGFAPIIAAAIIGAASSSGIAWNTWNKLNANQKRQSSNTADSVEERLKALKEAYLNFEGRSKQDKDYALNQFDMLWQELTNSCIQIGGSAGNRCIEERKRGGKWDWFKLYRDPIEEAPIKETPISIISSGGSSESGISTASLFGGNTNYVIGAIAVGLLAWGFSKS